MSVTYALYRQAGVVMEQSTKTQKKSVTMLTMMTVTTVLVSVYVLVVSLILTNVRSGSSGINNN